jgi:hypothetical protein
VALFDRLTAGRARQLCPGISDIDLLSNLNRVIDLDAKVTNGALDLRVAEQKLGPHADFQFGGRSEWLWSAADSRQRTDGFVRSTRTGPADLFSSAE